jgi:hypothetical protein
MLPMACRSLQVLPFSAVVHGALCWTVASVSGATVRGFTGAGVSDTAVHNALFKSSGRCGCASGLSHVAGATSV